MKTIHIILLVIGMMVLNTTISIGQTCVTCPSALITGQNASGIGSGVTSSGADAIAIGQNSQATSMRSIAIGTSAKSSAMSALAFGNLVNAAAPNSICMGTGSSEGPLQNSIANSFMLGFNSTIPTLFVGPATSLPGCTGNVGIGTSMPDEKLTVNGIVHALAGGFMFPDGTMQLSKAFTPWISSSPNIYFNTGFVGIGTNSPKAKLDVFGDIILGLPGENFIINSRSWVGDALIIAPQNGYGGWDWSKSLTLKDNGQVFIGSEPDAFSNHQDYRLAVNGKVVAKEIVVSNQNWADYVFDINYSLADLKELNNFIKKYKRLPGLPSAEEVKKNGVEISEMTSILLRKIEELTLYIIEQDKKTDQLDRRLRHRGKPITLKY